MIKIIKSIRKIKNKKQKRVSTNGVTTSIKIQLI